MKIQATKKSIKHEESRMQQSCVSWFRLQYRQFRFLLFAIPNGSKLAGNQTQRAIQGKRLKAEGLVAGVSDLFLSVPSGDLAGLYMEAKTETGRQSDSQKEFEAAVLEAGYGYCIFRSLPDFQSKVKSYLENGSY